MTLSSSAAAMLGCLPPFISARARRSVCVIDAGAPRNRFADTSHGFFGQDGNEPHAMIAEALAQLQRYPP